MTQKARVLIVDDVPQNVRLVAALLTPEGYDISVALTSQNALEQIKDNDFDLILLDIMMPDINGIELCQTVKALPGKQEIPIIFLTAKTEEPHILSAFEAGAVDYLCKPYNPSELAARVRTQLELKFSRDLIQRSNFELQQALDLKNQFLSMAAHEINNPLQVSIGYLDLIEVDPNIKQSPALSEYVALIKESNARIQERINEFLSRTALELNRIEIRLRRVNVVDLLDDVIKFCAPMAQAKQQEVLFKSRLDAGSNYIKADYHRLFQVLENLLGNAIKYSPNQKSIQVEVSSSETQILFAIQDQGPGFTEADKEKAFGYFQRLSAQPTGGECSVGMGLAVARQIIELHQGKIWLESEYGKGATLFVELPKNLN